MTIIFRPILLGLALAACTVEAAAAPPMAPAPKLVIANKAKLETAIFAGGCFWGVEAVFDDVKGVKSAISGFAGGNGPATYKQVIRGGTGHAEAVRVTFDPNVVSYGELMHIFFSVITDPTQLNRQGPDVGEHYRNALFPLNERQKIQARAYIKQLDRSGTWNRPLVTTIETKTRFYKAEEYHQDFMMKNPRNPYILAHDAPKMRDFRDQFAALAR